MALKKNKEDYGACVPYGHESIINRIRRFFNKPTDYIELGVPLTADKHEEEM